MSSGFKLSLFLILGVVSFILGWWEGVWSHGTVVNWIRYGGYWMILGSTILWVYSLLKAYPAALKKDGYRFLSDKKNLWAIVLILGLWGVIQFNEDKNFKILLDEPVLVNTSRVMHFERQTYVVSNATRVDGILASKGYVDKRPNFFPFLICTLHDLTGFRVENAFYLNSALTLALLALTFVVGVQVAGQAGGFLSLGLLASVPLVWHQSNGAGFEILNMVMILFTLKVAIDYFNKPSDVKKLSALCLTVAMLSQVRYESILFVIPVGILVLMGWSLAKKISLPWGVWVTPLLLIPVLWQQRVFNLDPGFWELFSVDGAKQAFSLDYVGNNIAQAVYFFFDWIRQIPNAPLVAYIGWVAVLIFLVRMCLRLVVKKSREQIIDEDRPVLALWVFFLGFALYFGLLMCYAFDLGRYMVDRLALPLYLALALAAAIVGCRWIVSKTWNKILGAVVLIGFLAWTVPSGSSREYAAIYYPMVEGQYVTQFIKEHKNESYMVVADMSMLWTTYNLEAIPNRAVNNQPQLIKYYLENPNNPTVYVMQSLEYDPHLHRFRDLASEPLTDKAVLKPVKDYRVGSFRIMRMSRMIDLEGVTSIDDSKLFGGSESEKLQNWVNQLP